MKTRSAADIRRQPDSAAVVDQMQVGQSNTSSMNVDARRREMQCTECAKNNSLVTDFPVTGT